MYLSRLLLTGEQWRNPYEVHRSLWRTFPSPAEMQRDFLFSVEERAPRNVQVIMLSARQPEYESDSVCLLACKVFEPKLQQGDRLGFLLTANPIKSISDAQGRVDGKGDIKKCRVPLIKEQDQITWLKRKFNGAALINSVEIEKQPPLYFRKRARPGKIQSFKFMGELQVEDSAELKKVMRNGIGPAKAFGCGLLLVRRI